MAIESVKAYALQYPEPHFNGTLRYITLARVETTDGLVGWGESISQMPEAALATRTLIDHGLRPLLLGENALNVERLWQTMLSHIWWYGSEGIAAFAVSAVDMALWDIKGKALGMPVCQLIGGQLNDQVAAMASIIFDMEDMKWTENEFQTFREQGYRVVKGGWGMRPAAVFGLNRKRDIDLVQRIRSIIGDDIDLIVDVPGVWNIWDVPTAIQRVRDLEPYRLRWIEQPLLPSDLEAHRRLRAAVSTPIGTGEDEWNVESYSRLLNAEAVDVVQIDPGRCHGITGAVKVIKLIEAKNLRFSAHTWSSALNTAASIHLLATSTCGTCLDFKPHESPMQHELVSDPWGQHNGYIKVRDVPGLGVTVQESVVKKYEFKE